MQSKLNATDKRHVPVTALWTLLTKGLSGIWPSRYTLDGVVLGGVWPCPTLALAQPSRLGQSELDPDTLVPFHKLTGWTAYSLIEPIQKLLERRVEGVEDMTGLPEYRNGALCFIAFFSLLLPHPP